MGRENQKESRIEAIPANHGVPAAPGSRLVFDFPVHIKMVRRIG
jgi:hypothetical protein